MSHSIRILLCYPKLTPASVPPNCCFETDDIEKEWLWKRPFDFIFCRMLAGSLADTQAFIQKAYK